MISRRTALKRMGAAAGAAAVGPRILGGCGGGDGGVEPGITTVVLVCMENRSFDHYLGSRALEGLGGDGLAAGMSNLNLAGESVAVYHESVDCVADPPHGWSLAHHQWNDGANDGFVTAYQMAEGAAIPPYVMGYFTRDDLPFTHALADAGVVCDRWFCSLLGPTWPNRMYLLSAQSGGMSSNDLPTMGGRFPWPTIFHRMNDASIPWAYYYSDLPFVPLFEGLDDFPQFIKRVNNDFFDDALAGTLAPFSVIEPAFAGNDDHPPHHPILGQQFLAAIYESLAASPQWNELLLCVTYDEHGGFFDHVPPPAVADDRAAEGFGQAGFRVPAILAGPYVKRGQVSSVVRDHTSVIRHLENMWGLPPLTMRDAAANDLSEAIDAARLAAGDPAPPDPMPAIVVDESEITAACYKRREPTDLEKLADRSTILRPWDRRAGLRDTLFAIGEQLERLGKGGIRRGR